MLVKHNLFTETTTQFVSGVWRASSQYRYSVKDNIITFSASSDQTTSLSALGVTIKDKDKNLNYLIEVDNLSDKEIKISTGNDKKVAIVKAHKKGVLYFNTSEAYIFAIDVTELDTTTTFKIKINSVMVSDEPVDIYLPHKENLPKDKQPLLPPEGHYKEIQAL